MNVTQPLPLLGGLSPQQFMKQHWQKKPLLVRQAVPNFKPLLDRSALFELAARDDVQSRMVIKEPGLQAGWRFRHGPFQRRALPPLKQPGWTMLIQGVDLYHDAAHALMNQFRFVPDARLDDLMVSYATDQGGVGPHFDSYDVFLLQAQGRRRWRIGSQKDLSLQPGVPLKILANFEPEEEYLLEPGDMLYLPPRYAHDGIAEGECMTYSIGFRIPNRAELATELLQRLAEEVEDTVGTNLYRDPDQLAVGQPAEIPAAMLAFAQDALRDALKDPHAFARGLGEYMTEPKPNVWFDAQEPSGEQVQLLQRDVCRLDRRTRMLFDEQHIYINGESFAASGRDAALMRILANERTLSAKEVGELSVQALELLESWTEAGWVGWS